MPFWLSTACAGLGSAYASLSNGSAGAGCAFAGAGIGCGGSITVQQCRHDVYRLSTVCHEARHPVRWSVPIAVIFPLQPLRWNFSLTLIQQSRLYLLVSNALYMSTIIWSATDLSIIAYPYYRASPIVLLLLTTLRVFHSHAVPQCAYCCIQLSILQLSSWSARKTFHTHISAFQSTRPHQRCKTCFSICIYMYRVFQKSSLPPQKKKIFWTFLLRLSLWNCKSCISLQNSTTTFHMHNILQWLLRACPLVEKQ